MAKGARPDLVAEFIDATKGDPEGDPRSYTTPLRGNKLIEARQGSDDRDSRRADIGYHGIFGDKQDAEKYIYSTFGSGRGDKLNQRSAIHELGHWLGLDHEESGLYGYYMHRFIEKKSGDDTTDLAFAKTLFSTFYDAGSVMDAIGQMLFADALKLLKRKRSPAGRRRSGGRKGILQGQHCPRPVCLRPGQHCAPIPQHHEPRGRNLYPGRRQAEIINSAWVH